MNNKKKCKNTLSKRLKKNRRRKKLLRSLVLIILIGIGVGVSIYIHNHNASIKVDSSQYEASNEYNYEAEKFQDKINSENISNSPVENLKTDVDKFEKVNITNENKGVPVLCYHSIGYDESGKSPLIVSPQKFKEHMKGLKDNGYTTLTISELEDYLVNNKPIPVKSILITFDDGYKDNYTNAFPILKELNMNATIFVVSSLINGETSMTSQQIKEMSDYGIDIESHTVSHKRLSEMSYNEQLEELSKSKKEIEEITGKSVIAAAYPEGMYNDDTKSAVENAGYKMGFTIEHGYADRDDNFSMLNRICIDYTFNWNNINYIINNIKK